jgi:glycine cleavage system aminomethyltransferase T
MGGGHRHPHPGGALAGDGSGGKGELVKAQDTQSTTLYFGPWYRRSPFFEATLRYGCKAFDIYNHMYLPAYYDDPIVEYWHLLNAVTLWDVAVERVVQISGPNAFEFTNMLTPRDLTNCAVGQGKYALITAQDGGIINDPVLLRRDENCFWLCLADSDAGLWARGVAVNSGMQVEVSEPHAYPLQVQGPKSKDVMSDLFGGALDGVKYYWTMDAEVDGIPVVISRTGWTAEVGYEVYLLDPARGDDLWERIIEAGGPHDIRPIAPSEARRIEAGIFNYNSDMSINNNPLEVMGLERLVEEQEADYIGKEALMGIKATGVKRKLVGIEVLGEPLSFEISEFRPALHEGRRVGHVTDLIWSPRLERNIGYVWVPIELAGPGTRLEVEDPGGRRVPGQTASIPFIDPRKRIPAAG